MAATEAVKRRREGSGGRLIGRGNLGAEITSLQASRATADDVRALMEILARHGVVCLRDQDMTPAQYVAFAKLFGEIEPSTRERYWLPEQNEIYVISNVVENGADRQSERRLCLAHGPVLFRAAHRLHVPLRHRDATGRGRHPVLL